MTDYRLTFIRHGESVGNMEERIQGQSDLPLTPRGEEQVRQLIVRWKKEQARFDQVITSPLQRAEKSAEMICQAFGCPLEIEPLWQARHTGGETGLTRAEAEISYPKPDFYTPYDTFGGDGEGDWALYLRAGAALQKLLEMPPARYLVVSHGGILNQAMHVIFGITPQANGQGVHFRFVNTAFATVYYEPDRHQWRVWGLNDFTHLAVKNINLDEDEES